MPAITALDFRVRYAETDQMGVVYHANYLVWCEMARTELIRRRGPTYAELERAGVFLAVSDLSIRYLSPARYDDLIRAESWVDQLRSRTVAFGYQILRLNDDGTEDCLATATTTLVVLDDRGRPRRFPPDLMELLSGD